MRYIKKRILKRALIILIWLLIWQLVSVSVDSALIMAGPLKTLKALGEMAVTGEFYAAIAFSACRVLAGFFIALFLALFLAPVSFKFGLVREFLQPFFLLIKSIPVASFIIIALLWMGSKNLAVFITALIALPVLYSQLLAGLSLLDKKNMELARVFRLRLSVKISAIIIPEMGESFLAACRLALGMSFKAGIAAEVIAGTANSIGEGLYMAKIYFATGTLFAWTFVIVALSWLCEKIFVKVFCLIEWFLSGSTWDGALKKRYETVKDLEECGGAEKIFKEFSCFQNGNNCEKSVSVSHLSKSYADREILSDLSFSVNSGELMALVGESGAGKTTLFSILLRNIEPDEGEIDMPSEKSAVFQDIRLFSHLSAVANVMFTFKGSRGACDGGMKESLLLAVSALLEVLPTDCLWKPVHMLSGGEKRRVELVRAMLFGDVLLLDEPFTGMDEENKKKAAVFIRKYQKSRPVILSAHEPEQVSLLAPEQILKIN